MSDRLNRLLAGIWVFAGIAGILMVIYILLRGSEPISSEILAVGGSVWFAGLSFWAAFVMRRIDRSESRYNARFDRLENRLDERFNELSDEFSDRFMRVDERFNELSEGFSDRFLRVEERLTDRIDRLEERLN